MLKNTLTNWFSFSKRERNAGFILLSILAIIMVLPYFFPAKKPRIIIDKDAQLQLDAYFQQYPSNQNRQNFLAIADTTIKDTTKPNLFYFDPNTLDEEGFIKLGLPLKTSHTIINYRTKGGYFKTPEDIRKIYGLSKTDADRLIPYIHIASKEIQPFKKFDEKPGENTKNNQYEKLNINTASAEEWKTFPGIGDVLANRIVKFRSSMKGFKSVDQVGKTYGLSDSVFRVIKPYLYIIDSTNH